MYGDYASVAFTDFTSYVTRAAKRRLRDDVSSCFRCKSHCIFHRVPKAVEADDMARRARVIVEIRAVARGCRVKDQNFDALREATERASQ